MLPYHPWPPREVSTFPNFFRTALPAALHPPAKSEGMRPFPGSYLLPAPHPQPPPLMKHLVSLLTFLALGIATTFAAADAPRAHLTIKPTRNLFPVDAQNRGIVEGWARVAIAVDTQGHLLDHLVTEASDRAFAREASLMLRSAEISPPTQNGQPIALRTLVDISFRSEGAYIIDDFQAIIELYLHGTFDRSEPVRLVAPNQLDLPPHAVVTTMPPYPVNLATQGITGRVVLDFYIDTAGRVRLPAIVYADHDELADLALAAITQWRFEPPTAQGEAVLTRVRQPLDFALAPPLNPTVSPAPSPHSS